MSYDFCYASWSEAVFCAKHYEPLPYWSASFISPDWYSTYQMGGEI
jgi:hypothetical protein